MNLSPLPKRLFACCDHTSGTSSDCSPICSESYLTLDNGASGVRLLGVPPGGQCQVFLPSATVGFVVSVGSGQGHAIQATPNWPITEVATEDEADVFNFIIGAVGTSEAPLWRQIKPPAAGTWRLESVNGQLKFVDGTSIPGLDGVCDQSTTVAKIRPFGCYTADATEEEPEWAMRRLAVHVGGVFVGVEDEDGNFWMKCLNPASEEFTYPGSVYFETIKYENLVAVDEDGDPISGGLEVVNFTTTPDAVAGYFSPTTKKFYRAPAHARANFSNSSTTAITAGSTVAVINSGAQTINFPAVLIAFSYMYRGSHKSTTTLYRDGALIATFDGDDNTSDPNSTYSGTFVDTGVTPGSHTYEVRAKPGTDGNVDQANLTICTLG